MRTLQSAAVKFNTERKAIETEQQKKINRAAKAGIDAIHAIIELIEAEKELGFHPDILKKRLARYRKALKLI